jgi:hypothetical protein
VVRRAELAPSLVGECRDVNPHFVYNQEYAQLANLLALLMPMRAINILRSISVFCFIGMASNLAAAPSAIVLSTSAPVVTYAG